MKTATALIGGLALTLGTALAAQQTQPSETTPPATDQAPAQDTQATPADAATDAAATPAASTPADPANPEAKAADGDPSAVATTEPVKDKKKKPE